MPLGGSIVINPFNVGERIMITAEGNNISVSFTAASFITNYVGGGGVINPNISLVYATIELVCRFNSGQTYYDIVRVSQNRDNSVCTVNSTKISAINNINNIPNVVISSPSSNQYLVYNGTNWINQSLPTINKGQYNYNSSANLAANNFLQTNGQNANIINCVRLISENITINRLTAKLTTAPGTGNSRTFTLYKNGVATSMLVTISGTALAGDTILHPQSFTLFDELAIFSSNSGGAASIGYVTLEYTYN